MAPQNFPGWNALILKMRNTSLFMIMSCGIPIVNMIFSNRMKSYFKKLPQTTQGMIFAYIAWTIVVAISWILYMTHFVSFGAPEFLLLLLGLPLSLLTQFLKPDTGMAVQLILLSACGYVQWPVIGILITKFNAVKPVSEIQPLQKDKRKIKMGYSQQRYKILKQKYATQGNLAYYLELFGNFLAEREGYKELDGMEAIYYYLVCKFCWMPKDVRSMSFDDIRFVLSEEMVDWTAPPESRIE